MYIGAIPFVITKWGDVAPTEHPGEAGMAIWRTRQFGDIRVRIVEYHAWLCRGPLVPQGAHSVLPGR